MSLCNILATDKIEIMFSRIRKKTDAAVFFLRENSTCVEKNFIACERNFFRMSIFLHLNKPDPNVSFMFFG